MMYYPAGQHVHYLDAHRILELHRMQCLVEKQRHGCGFDQYEPLRRLARVQHVASNPDKPLTSFKIDDILERDREGTKHTNDDSSKQNAIHIIGNDNNNALDDSDFSEGSSEGSVWNKPGTPNHNDYIHRSKRIIRPWSTSPNSNLSDDSRVCAARDNHRQFDGTSAATKRLRLGSHADSEDEEIDVEGCDDNDADECIKKKTNKTNCTRGVLAADLSPLDALVAMSSKTFMGIESFESQRQREQEKHKTQSPRKKRKTRTAFTNQQIYELERRFILQKYLTPADRDEIAGRLGLTCAQVITWFQNRRAKFKRDIEEMKNDVVATSPKPCDNQHSE